ncbi:PAS domain-containing sensor histidine kinase [Ancylomarina longa]|uniref:histidine kinase n=1 Tax=Ancylomarina longa TaxID=2487017 RepID=A0A434AVR9_9BACT|nr:PAS domain S-box protein [Ancylomarina longa]RUT78550.1 PAS domain S-box protein [Ancylomarina longa]
MTQYSKEAFSDEAQNKADVSYPLISNPHTAFVVFEAIMDAAGELVDARYVRMNTLNEQLIGHKASELIGRTVLEVYPKTKQEWFERLKPVVQRKESITYEMWHDTTGKYCLTNVIPMEGLHFGFVSYQLHDCYHINEKLQVSENRYRSLLSKMNSAFAVFSVLRGDDGEVSDARFIDVNSRVEDFAGLKLQEVIGKRILDVFPDLEKDWLEAIKPAATDNKNVKFEKWFTPLGLYLSVKAFPFGEDAFALIIKDKTEEVQLRQKLSDTELKYKTLFSGMDAGFVIYDAILDENGKLQDFRHVDLNAKMEEYISKSADEVIGKTVLELFPDTERIWFEKTEPVVYEKRVVNFQLKHNPLGKYFFCSVFSLEKNRVAVISYDITEKELLKEELIKSEQKYRALFHDNNSVEMVMNAVDGSLTDVNEAAVRFYGYSREKLLSMNISDITTRARDAVEELLILIAEGKAKHFDSQHRLSNGELREVVLYSDRVKIDGKVLLHFIIHDITESKKISLENQKLSNAVENGPAAVTIIDVDGNMEYVNQKKCNLTGYSREELLGKNPRIFKSGKMTKAEYQEMWKTLLKGEKWVGEFYNRKKDGDYYWESASIIAIKNNKEEIVNFIKIAKDITEQKRLENQLLKAKLKAEESDRLKSAFLANLSHEVRTPLNGIMGFTSLLFDEEVEKDEDQRKEYADIIQASSEQLLMIMNDLMDISKIEAGKLSLNESLFSINEVLDEVSQFHVLSIKQAGKDIGFNYDFSCTTRIKADKERIRQVIDNLVKNAIKFTDEGTITFGYKCQKDSLMLYVQDTGIGIAPEDQLVIFDRFRQVDPGANRVYGGNGLGLTICKELVELMGGTIWVESEVGKGSKFCFTVPVDQVFDKDNKVITDF